MALLVGPGELCSSPTHGNHHADMRSGRHGMGYTAQRVRYPVRGDRCMLVTAAGLCDRKGQPRHLQCVACWRWSMPPMTRPTIVKLARKPLHACGCDRPMRPAGPVQAPAVCCMLRVVHAAYDQIRYSLAGQDTRPSPERPGFESWWRKSYGHQTRRTPHASRRRWASSAVSVGRECCNGGLM